MLVYFRSERVLCVWGAVYRAMGRKSIVGKINVFFLAYFVYCGMVVCACIYVRV